MRPIHLILVLTIALVRSPAVWAQYIFSPDGKTVAIRSYFSFQPPVVILRDVSTGETKAKLKHDQRIGAVVYSPDGKSLAVGTGPSVGSQVCLYGEIMLWDTATGKLRRKIAVLGGVNALAFSPDGKTVATTSYAEGRRISLWDPASGKERMTLPEKDTPEALEFSPDGKTLAAVSEKVRLWDPVSGKLRLEIDSGSIASVDFADNGRIVITARQLPWDYGPNYSGIDSWDAQTGKRLKTLDEKGFGAPLCSADGKSILCLLGTRGVVVWDIKSGRRQAVTSSMTAMAFAPDGRSFATGSEDYTVTIWDTATCRKRASFRGADSLVIALNFTPDGRKLGVVHSNGEISLRELSKAKTGCSSKAKGYGKKPKLYTDHEAKKLIKLAEAVVPNGQGRPKKKVLEQLKIDPKRLGDRRVGQVGMVYFETWQLSEGFDLTWMAAIQDPTPLEKEDREIYGVRVHARDPSGNK